MKGRNALIVLGALCLASTLVSQTQINNTTTNLQLFPKVAHPDGGGYIFAWISNEDPNFEVYARVFDSNLSNPSPSNDEDCISKPSPADGHRLHAEIIPSIKETPQGPNKGAIVSWIDHNDQKVYTTRVSSNGYKDYAPIPVHDVNPIDIYESVQMCSDGEGGAIFT